MHIHQAELTDLNECHQLNGSYTTDYVWQMQTNHHGQRTDIRFDRVRLPRPMRVVYPRSPDELLEHWEQNGCFLVIRNLQEQLVGYIDAQPHPWQDTLWVVNLIIQTDYRRQGFGSRLLAAAKTWALQHHIHKIMLEVQTKNYPAIAFAQKHGFKFCGFNERYYTNGDITLYFYKLI